MDTGQWEVKFSIFPSILGISLIAWVIILKQLLTSGSWMLVNIPLNFVSSNIHIYFFLKHLNGPES